ncbi:MAG: sulfatase-like hydrolase/transferase, partial [Chloroflexota bacterium]
KMANFKGQNERSVQDIVYFLQHREGKWRGRETGHNEARKPLFLFINLMETHLPFWPPGRFVEQVAPYLRTDREARDILRRWNREAYRWAAPLAEPLGELEEQVLADLYDAEVAYQDDYLGQFFETLAARANRDHTLTVIVGDHGDGHGEHGVFGHGFVAYQELVQVPLIVHWPHRVPAGGRIPAPVSARRVYHTILEAAGPLPDPTGLPDLRGLSLREVAHGRDVEQGTAYSEIYPPLNFVKAIQSRQPELVERFGCTLLRRAIVKDRLKLIQVDGRPAELYDLSSDPAERVNLVHERPLEAAGLSNQLDRFVGVQEMQRDNLAAGAALDLEADEKLLQHLRGLGYIE